MLILQDKQKYNFHVSAWNDFDYAPQTGMNVLCELEDDTIVSLEAINQTQPSSNKPSSTLSDTIRTQHDGTATYSVRQTLQNYFSTIDGLIGEPPAIVDTQKQLDYFLSRRFLITAYNNLKSLDPTLHDHQDIKELFEIMQELHKTYYSINERIDVPQLAFEMIFLRAQPEFVEYIHTKERILDGVINATHTINAMLPEIQKREKEIKKGTRPQTVKEIKTIKNLRANYVDAIHQKATFTEELESLKDLKSLYHELYYQDFVKELAQLSGEYKKVISKILNYKAYDLDKIIWKHAESSRSIQTYFKESGIQGDYSTKTYLNYYLRTLDKEHVHDEQEELFKLQKYLEENGI